MQRKKVIKRLLIKTLVFNSFYYKMANEKCCNFSSLCEVGIIILLTTSHQIWWKQVYSKLLTTFVEGLAASSDQEKIVSKFRLKFNPTKMVKYTQRILRLSLKGLSRSIRFYSPPHILPHSLHVQTLQNVIGTDFLSWDIHPNDHVIKPITN